MVNVDGLKNQLIDNLWLPKGKEACSILYPRRRKNPNMKLFTLTNGINFNEIIKFEQENIINRTDVVAWVISDFNKKMRLEVENIGHILEGNILDDVVIGPSSQLQSHFPCDIVNLDFSSQEPALTTGRVEAEINFCEKNILLQKQKNAKKFVFIYTSLIDANGINSNNVVSISNSITTNGWQGLNIQGYPTQVTDYNQQKALIGDFIKEVCSKHGFIEKIGDDTQLNIPNRSEQLVSLLRILEKQNA